MPRSRSSEDSLYYLITIFLPIFCIYIYTFLQKNSKFTTLILKLLLYLKSKFIDFDRIVHVHIIERSIALRYFVSRLRSQIFRKMHDFRLLLSVHKSRRSDRLARATLALDVSRRFSNEIRFFVWRAENIILLDGIRKPIDAFQHKSHTSSTNGCSFSLISLHG